jgi:lipopolysaccharide transport system ATP-binding protein
VSGSARRAARGAAALLRGRLPQRDEDATIWALRDVDLDVRPGEVVGVIGGNGAGKSTLLKLLSRITEPTTGYGEIYGRVGSLLEVGTGFHPELTGRENVYLNGAILGMAHAEVDRKFDEIAAFAEVERFLDTPVKHYSSGMYLRLAFAVAAHLEPEILIVDEVLAVGDAAFQAKCLGKMSAVASEGRTVLFVSHNMPAVQSLCTRAIWLHQGRIVARGIPTDVVSAYLQSSVVNRTERVWTDPALAPGTSRARLRAARVRPRDDTPDAVVTVRTPFALEFEYWIIGPGRPLVPSVHLFNREGTLVFTVGPSEASGGVLAAGERRLYRERCHVPGDLLNDGTHRAAFYLADGEEIVLRAEDVLAFEVRDSAELRGGWFGKWPGAVRPAMEWESARLPLDGNPSSA